MGNCPPLLLIYNINISEKIQYIRGNKYINTMSWEVHGKLLAIGSPFFIPFSLPQGPISRSFIRNYHFNLEMATTPGELCPCVHRNMKTNKKGVKHSIAWSLLAENAGSDQCRDAWHERKGPEQWVGKMLDGAQNSVFNLRPLPSAVPPRKITQELRGGVGLPFCLLVTKTIFH